MAGYLDVTRLAVGSFLARYREPTLTGYTQDLNAFLGWCQTYGREALRVTRGELEMYVRHLKGRGYAAATVPRQFGTVATFYKYTVIDGVIPAHPAAAVSRPKVAWEGQKRTVLHPLEFAARLAAARTSGPNDHTLVCLLGMLGLRVSEACATDITDLRYEAGYELLHVLDKGAHPGRLGRRYHPADQPARAAPHLLHHRAGRRHQHPRQAIRDAPRRPAHHDALRHGQGKPRPPRRPRRPRLPRRHEHRLTPPGPGKSKNPAGTTEQLEDTLLPMCGRIAAPCAESLCRVPVPRGVTEDRERCQSSGRAAKARLVSRYQPMDFLGWRQRLFMASRASWWVACQPSPPPRGGGPGR
jgi:integrase